MRRAAFAQNASTKAAKSTFEADWGHIQRGGVLLSSKITPMFGRFCQVSVMILKRLAKYDGHFRLILPNALPHCGGVTVPPARSSSAGDQLFIIGGDSAFDEALADADAVVDFDHAIFERACRRVGGVKTTDNNNGHQNHHISRHGTGLILSEKRTNFRVHGYTSPHLDTFTPRHTHWTR